MIVSESIKEEQVLKIIKKYQNFQSDINNEYVVFFMNYKNATVTIFKNKKNKYKITVSCNTEIELNIVLKELKLTQIEAKEESENREFLNDQIGSDEVGTGDFFGPIIVVASLFKKNNLNRIKELGVDDSKKLTDEKIREIGPILIKEFPSSCLVVSNEKYNELVNTKKMNMVQIKTLLHNKALNNLHKKHPEIKHIYIDQFVNRTKYYSYLKNEKEVEDKVYFLTKGESHFKSVAIASVIARYRFLLETDKMNAKFNTKFPLGAGVNVDKFAKCFLKSHTKEVLDKLVKQNFKNYKRLFEE